MNNFLASLEFVKSLSQLQAVNSKQTGSAYFPRDFAAIKNIFSTLLYYDNYSTISSWIKIEANNLRLECLWELQHLNFIEFTTYIYHNAHLIPSLSDAFEQLIWCDDATVKQDCAEVVGGLLAVLVNLGVHTHRDIYIPGQKLLISIVEKFVEKLLASPTATHEPVPFLTELARNSTCALSRLRVFSSSVLRVMVHHAPDAVTMEEAVSNQAKLYTSGKSSPAIKQVFREILSNMTEECIIIDITGIISSKEPFNWRWLLTLVSVFVDLSSRGAELLQELVGTWLSQACVKKDSALLTVALLCARQACAENTQKFSTYSAWFGSLQVRPASAFVFLFNFLSELVPHEPVLCLKIHLNKVPSAPPNCHAAVADYAALAKTRLADLNQTTDYVGLFGEYTTTEQEGREADVVKIVSHFKQTKEVMKIVLEASVFRRQFYEKVFLAELMKDYNLEHIEFIEKLYSIGKIPHGLYNKWKLQS